MSTIKEFMKDTGGYIQGAGLIALTAVPLIVGLAEYGHTQWLHFQLRSQTDLIASNLVEVASALGQGKEPFESRVQMTTTMQAWADALMEGYINPRLKPKLVAFALSRSRSDGLRVSMQIEGSYESSLTRLARIGPIKFVRDATAEKYVLCLPSGLPVDKSPELRAQTKPLGKGEIFGKIQFDDESLEERDHIDSSRCPSAPLPKLDRRELVEAVRQIR